MGNFHIVVEKGDVGIGDAISFGHAKGIVDMSKDAKLGADF